MWGRIMEHMSNIQGNMERRYGEGTKIDLDYGKLVILGLVSTLQFKYHDVLETKRYSSTLGSHDR